MSHRDHRDHRDKDRERDRDRDRERDRDRDRDRERSRDRDRDRERSRDKDRERSREKDRDREGHHSDKRKHKHHEKSSRHDRDRPESSDEKDAKRQKLNVQEDAPPGEDNYSHLKALEPIDPPEGPPDTVKEIHALLFNEKLPEEFESRCRLTRCELCSVDLSTANAAKMHYFGKPHQRNVCKFLPSIGYVPPTKREEQMPESVLLKPEENMKYCSICSLELRTEAAAISHYGGKNHAKKMKQYEALKMTQGIGMGLPYSAMAPVANESPGTSIADSSESTENGAKAGWRGKRSTAFCLPCQADFNTDEEYTTHITSDAHKAQCRNYGPSTSSELTESEYKYGKAEPISDIGDMLNKIRNDPLAAFECTMCNVKATCEENYRVHLEGKKHKKLVEKLEKTNGEYVKPPPKMTPFRCEYCQINCTDHTTMAMHLTGRKHLKKMADLGMLQVAPAPQQYHQYQQYQQYSQQYQQYYAGQYYGGYGPYGAYGEYPEGEGGEQGEGQTAEGSTEREGEEDPLPPPGEEPPPSFADDVPVETPSFADDV